LPRRSANHFWQHPAQGWHAQIMMRSVTSFIHSHGKSMYVSWGPLWFEKSALPLTDGNVIDMASPGFFSNRTENKVSKLRNNSLNNQWFSHKG
jgi:hypothetical protein